jgi:hypothetical protein
MPAQPRVRRRPPASTTSLETSASSVIPHLIACLQALGATAIADKVARCCTTFRVLTCANGHVYRPIPAERCRHRLCPHCARWRQQRAITRLWPVIQALRRRYPEDPLGLHHPHRQSQRRAPPHRREPGEALVRPAPPHSSMENGHPRRRPHPPPPGDEETHPELASSSKPGSCCISVVIDEFMHLSV